MASDHAPDPCPISGRCGVCGARADEHGPRTSVPRFTWNRSTR
jgi:hypothetical protein